MTKNYSRAAVSLLALALAFGAAGCTSTDTKSDPTAKVVDTATQGAGTATQDATPETDVATDGNQQDALNTYVDAAQAAIPQILDSAPGVYSSAEINAIGSDTLEFAYYYAEQADPAAAISTLDSVIPSLQSVCDTAVFPEMIQAGVTVDPKVRYTYYNADGSKIWEHTFSVS